MDPQACKVSQEGSSWMSLAVACALLAICLAPAAVLAAWLAVGHWSSGALLAAAIGGGICWLAASLALVATYFGNCLQAPVQGLLVGMLFRLGLPLAAVVILPKLGEPWIPAGIAATILGTYLVALVVETSLALRMVPASPRAAKAV